MIRLFFNLPRVWDSVNNKVSFFRDRIQSSIIYNDNQYNQRVMIQVIDKETGDTYIFVASDTYVGLYHQDQSRWVGQLNW